ncbi:MAG: PAS/PAC sensor hybrid histidine kinase [Hyphomonadaceae bacterium]|nr:MAG: PAS/PAC sensor hybrid histidine kinase [Hyphomonadaceae bacterium]
MSIAIATNFIEPLLESAVGAEASQIFTSDKGIRTIPVADLEGNIIGTLNRAIFLAKMSEKFGYDIYHKRPVTHLMQPVGLKIDVEETIEAAALVIVKAGNLTETPSIMVTKDDEYFGYASSIDIFRILAESMMEKSKDLEIAKSLADAAAIAKSDFVSTMSHEIRTPLNGVIGMAQALSRAELRPDHAKMVATISQSSKLLLRLVNDVLDMSKIEAGMLEISPTKTHLFEIFQSSVDLFGRQVSEKNLELLLDLENLSRDYFIIDELRLQQILLNLISNAVKFTKKGSVKIVAKTIQQCGVDFSLKIEVADTGIGMKQSFMDDMFQPFTQADSTISRTHGGTGLGLSITKKLVSLIGGNISVASKLGEGTTFSITLPITKWQSNETTDAIENNEPDKSAGTSYQDSQAECLKILVVEDNATNRLVIKTLFDELDVHLVFAENGKIGLETFLQEDFDCVLMDLQMPVMDGLTALREIRKHEKTKLLKRTPIVALTSNALPIHYEESKAAGADAHATKPIDFSKLLDCLERVLAEVEATNRAVA